MMTSLQVLTGIDGAEAELSSLLQRLAGEEFVLVPLLYVCERN